MKNKTRWDALSMRDRASLIKLYSQAGIKKLDDMRAHYNKFGEGGDTESEDYNTKLEKYRKIQSDYENAVIARDNANNAFWDFSRHYKGDRVYWYWTDKGKRLRKEKEDADLRFWDAKNELDAARNKIGNATLDEFTGTAYDPMYFWDFVARDRDKARKYYVEHGIRQSEKAQDVIDFFNSYGSSEGFNRIRENQKNWWLKRHPYRKIWQFGPKTALNATNWLQDRMAGLNNGTADGIYDLDTYTETSVMRSGNGHGAITVGTIDGPEWPYLFALPHEIAHITNLAGFATPSGSVQAEALEQNTNTQEGHDSRPSEKHSDIEALRYMLFKEGIYDSRGNEDATAEDIKKLREKYPKLRPLIQMDDEKAAWMINHVADADKKIDMSNIAATGGSLRRFADGGDTDDEYYDFLPASVATAKLPSINTAAGKRIAKNISERVASGKTSLSEVPDRYKSYVEGEVNGAMPVRNAINTTGVKTALSTLAVPAGVIAGVELGAASPELWTGIKDTAPYWGKAGIRMLKDLPAFEFVDRLPTVFGGKRMTELGGDATQAAYEAITGNHNLSNMSRALVRLPGEFMVGAVPGVAGDMLMRTGSSAVLRSLNNRGFQMANSLKSATAKMPVASTADANAYEIADLGGGYMLKSLMRGNPLEKQISKNGTINVNNVRALINKGSKVEQAVVDKVLASEEFAGKKAVDYNQLRKAVQDELVTYDRTPDIRFQDYGGESLNWGGSDENIKEWALSKNYYKPLREKMPYERDWEWPSEFIDTRTGKTYTTRDLEPLYKKEHGVTLNTFTFSSSRIPNGSGKHYDMNTLGHSRTYTIADEPDVLHVMESQSDWGQSAIKIDKNNDIEYLRRLLSDKKGGFERNKQFFSPAIKNQYFSDIQELEDHISRLEKIGDAKEQASYLHDNYTSRQIQENLRYAAEKGQTKMRYPTRETAAKIEGYSKSRSQTLQDNPELEKEYKNLLKKLNDEQQRIVKEYAPKDYIDESGRDVDYGDIGATEEWIQERLAQERASETFDKSTAGKEMRKKLVEAREKYNPDKWLEENVKEVYLPQHETILKKYDAFPKQYQKLFKGADVRTVTDPKGNTWYEVDVPKDYLNQEWAYANGGPLVNMFYTGGDKETIKHLAYKIGAYVHDGAGATPFGILKAVTSPQQNYDELKAYLWGPENAGFKPYTGTSTKPYLGNNIPTYNATINPNGQYVFPENMKGFIKEVANRNGNIYLNADLMPGSDKPRYDAANYPVNLFYSNNGNIAGNAADLYDFGLNYSTNYKTPKWQIKAMRKQGTPYAVRQDNLPFVFSNSPEAENTVTAFSYGEMGNKNESDEAIINAMSRLGNGTIEPASITFEYPERLENYASGGKIHIKPENRGKFTALKKRTGKTASWFKAHGTPAQKKMATFALNAAKWHKK